MRAVVITGPGGIERLVLAEVPDPQPGPHDVIVEVAATAVNRGDILQRRGFYPPPEGASPYPGLECSGRIAQLGTQVEGWGVGDEVCALLSGGGYAERVAVPVTQLLPVPPGIDLIDAAALPEVACTVWSTVVDQASLCAGETLLVHGGGSGVGTFAIQLAVARGATVIATARGVKHDAIKALGATAAIDYSTHDFVEVVASLTGGTGVDVILDIMGASYLNRNISSLAIDGRLVIIGLQGGTKSELNIGSLMAKRATVFATTLRGKPAAHKAAIVRAVRRNVWPLVSSGKIRPVVDRRLRLDDVAEAHQVIENGDHIGKVVLVVKN